MAINPTAAAGAYADALKRVAGSAGEGAGLENGSKIKGLPETFGDLLSEQVSELEKTTATGEKAAIQAAAGKGNLVDLVTQVSEAEVVLQTAVTVRDRVINAYQEIMKMPI